MVTRSASPGDAHYVGRDSTRVQGLAWWAKLIGEIALAGWRTTTSMPPWKRWRNSRQPTTAGTTRMAANGWVHPCRSVERRRENNEKTRFLSDEERIRLLQASKTSQWGELYLLVLLALTTGARKGELLGLRAADIDPERGVAYVGKTKNGDPVFCRSLQTY